MLLLSSPGLAMNTNYRLEGVLCAQTLILLEMPNQVGKEILLSSTVFASLHSQQLTPLCVVVFLHIATVISTLTTLYAFEKSENSLSSTKHRAKVDSTSLAM